MNWIQLAIIVCQIIISVTVCSVFVHTGWLSLCKYCQIDYKLDTGLIGRATDRTAGSGSDLLHSIIKSLHWIQWQVHLILWNVHIVYDYYYFIHEKFETQTYQIQNVLQDCFPADEWVVHCIKNQSPTKGTLTLHMDEQEWECKCV